MESQPCFPSPAPKESVWISEQGGWLPVAKGHSYGWPDVHHTTKQGIQKILGVSGRRQRERLDDRARAGLISQRGEGGIKYLRMTEDNKGHAPVTDLESSPCIETRRPRGAPAGWVLPTRNLLGSEPGPAQFST